MEEQVPELIAIDNEGTSGSHSSGIVGQAKLSNMGDTTKIIGEPLNVQFETKISTKSTCCFEGSSIQKFGPQCIIW